MSKASKRVKNVGRGPLSIEMKKGLFTWILLQHKDKSVVTRKMIKEKARELALDWEIEDFSASNG